jgi:hypothetical protein
MHTSVMIGPDAVYIDYEPDQPLDGFHSPESAAAFAQGVLTRDEAMLALWRPAARPPLVRATWRR